MMSNEFEEAFSEFLDRQAYDEAESALFDVVRAAFLAGWKAAGGPTPFRAGFFSCWNGKERCQTGPDRPGGPA